MPEKKSTSSKKTAKGTVPKKFSAKKTGLIKKLSDLSLELNEEALTFLVEQAGVLLNNIRLKEKIAASGKEKKSGVSEKKTPPPPARDEVEIQEGEGSRFFNIIVNSYRNFFALDEFKKIVRFCHSADSAEDASKRIYAWLSRERSDVLRASSIKSASSPALAEIYKIIIKTYAVKE